MPRLRSLLRRALSDQWVLHQWGPQELGLMKWGWFSWSPYPLKVFFEEKIVNLEQVAFSKNVEVDFQGLSIPDLWDDWGRTQIIISHQGWRWHGPCFNTSGNPMARPMKLAKPWVAEWLDFLLWTQRIMWYSVKYPTDVIIPSAPFDPVIVGHHSFYSQFCWLKR